MKKSMKAALLCGMFGCLCYGGGDWLTLFSWMEGNGFAAESLTVCEGLFAQLSWLVPVSEVMMLPVFIYWFCLQINGRTEFPRWMAFTNVLIIFVLLKGLTMLMPVSAFRLGFTNGLMSESMIVWFGVILAWEIKIKNRRAR